jgi:hypothetical protein
VEPWGHGLAETYRLTFAHGSQALFKVDGSDPECAVCSANREVAAYRIDALLGFDLTPMTILRSVQLPDGRVVDGSAMYLMRLPSLPGKTGKKTDRLRFFDAVVGNSDRHPENWLILANGRQVAIDHDRTFQYQPAANAWTCWEEEIDRLGDIGKIWGRKAKDGLGLAATVQRY